ncbi:hypothetical protein BGE01nite_39300 [Brevifollis gellanilyticus]|uniref:Uncharacterized protein n=1 Tax=Brevifollis gellanilyticus TaxID=748831 RepID=A0A512MD33_9BACT|nr:hypothetical protein BGE01nite_39300 [Brevifollis gellanilyticus]
MAGFSPLWADTDYYSTGPGAGSPDTLCDVWQGLYNGWGLAPNADTDFDGASNYVESVAGTDPRNPNDVIKVGNTAVTSTTVTFTFDAEKGKRYRILSDAVSPTGTFATVETHLSPVNGASQFIPSTSNPTQTITITKSGGSKFYKIETTDWDSDGDGVSDWAEGQLGMNPALASSTGNGASDGDTLHSLLSLTVESTANGYEKEDKTASSPVPTPGKLRLVRSYGTMALSGIGMNGAAGATDITKASASAGDYTLSTVNIPAGAGVPGTPYEVAITPVQDSTDEVPEAVKVTLDLPGTSNVPGPSGTLTIGDANPANAENTQLYVAYLGHESGAATTATGYATAIVNGDNTSASISVVFNNLSSVQNTAYVREGTTNDLAPALPTGQVSGFTYLIEDKPGHYSTDQAFLTALVAGQIGCAVSSANFSDKEIFGLFNKASGSTTFNPNAPSLVAPDAGTSGFQIVTEEQIERDIWRFMSQCTWGGTTAMYDQIRAKVTTRVNALGAGPTAQAATNAYLLGLTDWLDDQMNSTLTPTVNFQTLVMAGDNEDFMLRGNKPIHYAADPQINGARYTVTYDAAGNPTFGTTADNNTTSNNYPIDGPNRRREWWGMILQSKDQVRQRFTQALSEILIISEADQTCATRHYGTANFWDMLAAGAFGKYRNLLSQVSYNPMMGFYLSSFNNRMTYDAGGGLIVSPDENYAREIMQLFSIGLILRHPDGSLVLDSSGLPIPTYDQTDITELARVMTGFTHGAQHAASYYAAYSNTSLLANPSTSTRTSGLILFNGSSATNTWFTAQNGHLFWPAPWVYPMKAIGRIASTQYHDFGAKTLLAGKSGESVIPAQTITSMTDAQTHAAADVDLALAHNCLAGDPASNTAYNGHQNTPVNISRWLIQRLVTSNPSAGYVYRVQKRYRDTNGNLGEVLKAILLDYESRSLQLSDSSISHGRVKEPIVAFAATLRAFRAFSGAPMSILAQDTGFTDGDSPLPKGYPGTELAKYSTDNTNPPSLPAGWATGPFRFRFNDLTGAIGQSPQRAPSVFNWFLPDYILPGPMAEAGLFAPELQISTEANVVAKVNTHYNFTWSNLVGMSTQPGSDANISDFLLNNNFATPAVRFSLDGGATFINSLTFTSANWNTPQTLTVVAANTAPNLSSVENSRLRFTVAGTGSGFDSIPTTPVDISYTDNTAPNEGILALHSSFSTWVQEGGNTDTVTVRLQSPPPTGSSVTVNVASTSSQASASPSSLSFDSTNWNTDQTVTVTAVQDVVSETAGTANDTLTFTSVSSIGAWNSLTTSLPVNVVDNDDGANSYGILVTETGGSTAVTENNTFNVATAGIVDSFNIVLTKLPSATVTVTITQSTTTGTQLMMNTTTGGTTFQTAAVTRTFTTGNWNVAQAVLVRGNQETTTEGSYPANPYHYGTLAITASGGNYTAVPAQVVTVPVTDDDNRVIMAHAGNNETRVVEGATSGAGVDTIQVSLRFAPTGGANVVVNLGSNSIICEPANLTFTPANYATPQTVNVRAADDALSQGLRRAWYPNVLPSNATATATQTGGVVTATSITAAGAGYMTPPNVTFSAPTSGTTATGFCTLNATGGIASIVIANPGSGYTGNPTVTFSVVPPNVTNSKIIASATSEGILDTTYNNIWSATHTGLDVTIVDNDMAAVSITQSGGSTTVVEGGATDDFTVALTQQPTSDVTVTLTPSTQATCSVSTLTFTSANWSTGQNVTVTALNDATVEGDVATTIGVLVTSSDSAYKGLKANAVGVMVIDNDLVPLTVAHTNVFTGVSEGGTAGTGGTPNVSDTFTVALPKTPTASVTVTLIPDAQISVSPTTLTFTTTNSGTAQTVTVTAVDDAAAEVTPHNGMIRFAVSSADPFYNNPAHLPVFVPVKDNDSAGFSIVESSGNSTPTEGGTDSHTLVLTKQPPSGQNVVIDVTSAASADLLVSSSATFTGSNVTSGSPTATMTSTAGLLPGMFISGTNIAGGATVSSVTNSTTFVMSANALGTSTNITITATSLPAATARLTFTNANWNTTQTITTVAVADMVTEGREVATISHAIETTLTTDDTFDAVPAQTVNCFITDQHRRNESLIMIQSGGSLGSNETVISGGNTYVTEGDPATDSVDIYLSNAPQSQVIVTLSANSQMSFDKPTLVFTPANWSVPQTVQISAVDDTINDTYAILGTTLTQAAQGQTLTATASSGDSAFFGLTATATVNILDNESPAVKIVQTGGITTTTEGGTGGSNIDTYTAELTTPPNGDVVVRVTSASTTAGQTVSPAALTFNSANWNVPQTVTVTVVNDTTVEGNHRSSITHAIRSAVVIPLVNSATTNGNATVTVPNVGGLFTGMVVAGPGIPLNATISSINTTTNTFVLSSNATATASGVELAAYGTTPDSTGAVLLLTSGVTTSGGTTITCASTGGLLPGTLLYGTGIPAGAKVASVTNATTFVASAAATASGSGLTLAAITATTDTSGYRKVLTNGVTTAGSTAVTVDSTAGLAAGMNIFGPGITNGTTISSISSTNTTTLTLSAAATVSGSGLSLLTTIAGIQTVVDNITDNDNRIIIGVTGNDTRVHEDSTAGDTYSVVLRSAPTQNVTVTPVASFNNVASGSAATTFAAQGLSISPASMTFTSANWSTPQTFTLSGADNSVNAERARTVTISHTSASSDSNFNSQTIHQVAVSVLAKDDLRVLLIDNPSGHENGNTSTYRLALSRAPAADVNFACTANAQLQLAPPVPSGGTLVYGSSANLTFTPSNWNTFQTVTLRPVDDTLVELLYNTGSGYLHTGGVSHAVTSSDPAFNGLPGGIALMTITDNETPAVRILPSGGSTLLTEGGATDTYDVVLNTAPTANVTIGISTDAQVTADKASLTFTSGNWSTPQTVTLTAVNDAAVEGSHSGVVTHANAVSTDANFTFLPVPPVTASITDNEGAQLVVTQSGGNTAVVAGGAHDTLTIALNQAPTANVTVTLVPPMYIVPVPPHAKNWGYYTTDLSGSNQQKERVVLDYTEWNLLYRTTFYASLATAYGGSGNIPAQPSDVSIQNAHWVATKALVDKGDLWFSGGTLKARFPTLIEPNQAPPVPLPALNARQALMDCIYNLSGGNTNTSINRYLPQVTYDPKNPPAGTFHDEVRDRCRWTGYLMSTVMSGYVAH